MPEPNQYIRKNTRLACLGISLGTPPDLLSPGKFSRLQNIRGTEKVGALTVRPGLTVQNATPLSGGLSVHSIRRLNDNLGAAGDGNADFTHVVGAGARLLTEVDTTIHTYTIQSDFSLGNDIFSGRPMSLIPWRPNLSPRTWMYVGDTMSAANVHMRKVGRDYFGSTADYIMREWGITPPHTEPTLGGGGGGSTYYYRFRYRSSATGAMSNPSPTPVGSRTGLAAAITVSCEGTLDPQVDLIDIFRFGGALLDYRYVGTITNAFGVGPFTFSDAVPDATAQNDELLSTDNDQPFTVVGLPLTGTCSTTINSPIAGITTVTNTSGQGFKDNTIIGGGTVAGTNNGLFMKEGTAILIDSKPYIMYRATVSDTVVYIRGTTKDSAGAGASLTGVTWRIDQPALMAKPLPYVWGPFQNVLFACGDFYNPGVLYWSNGNDPDSASSFNTQEVTAPTEPLMNGFLHDGRCYIFSSERLFAVYPNFSSEAAWEILETPCQRGLLFNWAFCVTGEKEGGGEIYFLAKDGIYMTQGGQAQSITDSDLYSLFPHEGTPGNASGNLLPIDLTQRLYLRLAYYDGLIYFDYKDTAGAQRTLVYDTRVKGWFPDTYTPALRMHYGEEGREVHALLSGSDDGRIYKYSVNATDNGTVIACIARTKSENFDDAGAQHLLGQIMIDADTGDSVVTATPYINNEAIALTPLSLIGPAGRRQRILDIQGGAGQLCYNTALDFTWNSGGTRAVLFMWEPSAVQKPEDIQQRCVEWHEFLPGGNDSYVMGVILWVDTRDLGGVAQTKTIGVWSDQTNTGNNLTVSSDGEQKLEFSWPVFKGKLGRLLPTDTNRCKILKWEWIAQSEPLLISKWDTNWQPLGERTSIAYLTGCVVVADTLGMTKVINFQSEFEGTVTALTPIGGVSTISGAQRITKSYAFTPIRAEQVRFFSYDNVVARLYTWEWVVHFVEGRFLANWDATYRDFQQERLLKGIRVFADTINLPKTIQLEIDNVPYQTFTMTHNGRETIHYDVALNPNTNEYPRARSVRLYPIDANPAFLYSIEYFAEEEPGRLANWNAKWEDGGYLGAKWLQGFITDADTEGADKQVVVEYYPEAVGSALTVAGTFTINHTGRAGKAVSFDPPVVAHKFRLRPTDTNQKWLYSVRWVWEPHPEKVRHWETQGYAHGLASYQHRRDAYIAYESSSTIYWIQTIDGQEYAIRLPDTGGEYRKVYTPCLPIKGKIFKDTFRCDLPGNIPLVYTASLSAIEDSVTGDEFIDLSLGDTSSLFDVSDPSVSIV